jgi:hypothetical protein
MTQGQLIVLFTAEVFQIVPKPQVCFKFLKEVDKHFKLSQGLWKESEGLLTIAEKMRQHIQANIHDFKIDTNLANKP